VGAGSTALVRFDLSALPGSTTASDISNANLRLFVNRLGVPGAVDLVEILGPWVEMGLTYNTTPTLGVTPVATIPVTQNLAFVTVDITGLVKTWVTTPSSNYGVAVQASGTASTTVVYLDSKESVGTSHAPQLDITLEPVTGNAVLVRIGGYTDSNTAAGAGSMPNINAGGVGASNTAFGSGALLQNAGAFNTAVGAGSLELNTTGARNTGVGDGTLGRNTEGNDNTATGTTALSANTTGMQNTANGGSALFFNTTGSSNTAMGFNSLVHNTTGNFSTAIGFQALFNNIDGFNEAVGSNALYSNTHGAGNVAVGGVALSHNTTGNSNTAVGVSALVNNTVGSSNTAVGSNALNQNSTGSRNIAVGPGAGINLKTGNNNIYIGNAGGSSDQDKIKIGTTQTAAYIAGIRDVGVTTGVQVFIGSDGQLGTLPSSRVFKWDIHDIGDAGSGLMRLRPVVFRYKQPAPDGTYPVEYGLIAEEVADVIPELVTRSATGEVQSVRYHLLNVMLLSEVQKQQVRIRELEEEISGLREAVGALARGRTELASTQ
jgi:hypothetical protein